MRLMLAAVSAILASVPAFFRPPPLLLTPGEVKDSPQPYRPSGVRATRRSAAKRRNKARMRK